MRLAPSAADGCTPPSRLLSETLQGAADVLTAGSILAVLALVNS
jgi:hypothetical protein